MARKPWSQALLNDYRELVNGKELTFKLEGQSFSGKLQTLLGTLPADASQQKEGLDPVFLTGLARLEEELAGSQSGAAVCLICLEDVGPDEATWDCQAGCFCLFHLVCIQVFYLLLVTTCHMRSAVPHT